MFYNLRIMRHFIAYFCFYVPCKKGANSFITFIARKAMY